MPQLPHLRKMAISLAIFAVVALGSAAITRADSFTYNISIPNSGLSGSPPPYATVSLTQVTVNQGLTVCSAAAPCINVNVHMLANASGGTYQLFGNGLGNGAFGFDINGSVAWRVYNGDLMPLVENHHARNEQVCDSGIVRGAVLNRQ